MKPTPIPSAAATIKPDLSRLGRRSGSPPAFTLMEMLVAISIMVVLVLIIDQVFVNASNGVRAGMGTSEVTHASQTIQEQLQRDLIGESGSNMLDPASGGILVIINHKVASDDGTNFTADHRPFITNLKVKGGEIRRTVRSDQLLFIANAAGWQPLTPKDLSTGAGNTTGFSSDYTAATAMVWYGHVVQPYIDPATGNTQPPEAHNYDLGNDTVGNPNRLANEWVLGRQALLMVADGTVASYQMNKNLMPVNNGNEPLGGFLYRFGGFDDCTAWAWTGTGVEAVGSETYLLRTTPAVATDNHYLWTGDGATLAQTDMAPLASSYKPRALALAFPGNRLWTMPRPEVFSAGIKPVQAAQMSTDFAGRVSDFCVEFAGDVNNDGKIDTLPQDGANNYAFQAGTAIANPGALGSVDINGVAYPEIPYGGIVWYASPEFVNYPGAQVPTGSGNYVYDSTKPLVFAQGDGPMATYGYTTTGWAAATLPQHAYNPYATYAALGSPTYARDGAFVWRHDDNTAYTTVGNGNNSKWPYLLRIRYRLHDKSGQLASGTTQKIYHEVVPGTTDTWIAVQDSSDLTNITSGNYNTQIVGEAGKWFEQIVKVNRP